MARKSVRNQQLSTYQNYADMKYRDLVSLASDRGVLERGMKKAEIIAALEAADNG